MTFLAHVLDPWVHDAGHLSLKLGVFFNTKRQSLHLLYFCLFFFCDVLKGFNKFFVLFIIFCLIIETLEGLVKEKRLCYELMNTWHTCHAQPRGRPNKNIVVLLHILQPLKLLWVAEVFCNGGKLMYQFLALCKWTTRSNNLIHILKFWIT